MTEWLKIAMELKENPSSDDVIQRLIGNPTPSIVDNIYVMSYNLWYKSVERQGHPNLRRECNDGSKNKCIDNIVQIIKGDGDSWDGSYTHPETFDFIATQESTSYFIRGLGRRVVQNTLFYLKIRKRRHYIYL
jgi:hypothetical protein